ncbi:MAG: molybdenum cofactor guanylyltransferase [Verrucomicrobiota bacterium]|jgi:molybdopterin-guanine dinucleotide biosynthesis protein A
MNISAVLLAGGESRRMGTNKATLEFQGAALWQIQFELLRKLEPVQIFVSARADPAWRPREAQFVGDESPSRGPLSGIAATLAKMGTSHLLALAIDMPFMSEDFLRALCNLAAPGRGVLPMIGDWAEPLAAIYPAEVYVDLASALSGADFSLQSVTKRLLKTRKLSALPIAPGDEHLFRNLNEPDDLSLSAGLSFQESST